MTEPHAPSSQIDETEPDALMTLAIVVIGAIVLAVVVVFVQGLYERAQKAQFQEKVVAEQPAELRQLRIAQLDRLHKIAWADKNRGLVTIPIERAMKLLVEEPNPAATVLPPAGPEAGK